MLEGLVDSEKHSDMTLVVRDGSAIHAHSLLLATRCPALYSVTCVWWVTLNNASDCQANRWTTNPNPNPSQLVH